MTSMDDQFKKLEAIHRKGFARFVLVRGVLGWGIGTALLFSLIMWIFTDSDIRRLLPLSLIIFPIGGIVWGATMWLVVDRKYKRQLRQGDS